MTGKKSGAHHSRGPVVVRSGAGWEVGCGSGEVLVRRWLGLAGARSAVYARSADGMAANEHFSATPGHKRKRPRFEENRGRIEEQSALLLALLDAHLGLERQVQRQGGLVEDGGSMGGDGVCHEAKLVELAAVGVELLLG